jgi:D-3-phosphoglycerate dehydrogenase
MLDAAAFAAMRRGTFFVNAARGELVDEAALLAALDSGHLGGCALDVGRASDQMPAPALARHPRVIASPHVGGLTLAATEHQALETVDQLAQLLAGTVPRGAVNAAQARRWRERLRRSASDSGAVA